jgi:hypothetical protein
MNVTLLTCAHIGIILVININLKAVFQLLRTLSGTFSRDEFHLEI